MRLITIANTAPLSVAVITAALLAGCVAKPPAPDAAGSPPPLSGTQVLGTSPLSAHRDTAIVPADNAGRVAASYGAQTPLPSGGSPPPHLVGGAVSLDFADTDIRAVVAQVLGSILHVTYSIDPAVHGKVTLHTAHPLPSADLIPTLQTLLGENHAELIADHDFYRVVPAGTAGAVLAGGSALGGAMVVPLQYVEATHLASVLQPYVAKGGKVIAAPGRNALIVDGDPQTRATLVGLITAFDVDALAGQSYILFPVNGLGVKSFATAFESALHIGKEPGTIQVVPLERIDAVMVIAPSVAQIAQANRVYAVLARQEAATRQDWHIYYLRNTDAEDAAYVLQQAFTPDNVTAQPTQQSSGGAAQGFSSGGFGTSGATTAGSGSLGSSSLGGSSPLGTSAGGVSAGGPALTVPSTEHGSSSSANPLLGPLGGGAGNTSGGDGTRIIPDPRQNAILVYATADQDATVSAMLRKIDIEPLEVEIDATIAEVGLSGALQYGTQFFFKSGGINAVLSQGATSNLAENFPGFVLSGAGVDAAPLAIAALQSVTTVKVLSSPQLLVQNDRTANLLVGNLVPYLSQTSQSTITSGAPVVNSINYQETGVILQITPRISDDGLVALTISQQVSGVAPTVTTQGINSPTFSERAVSSSVVIHDGQTVGLAGLITDDDQRGNAGLPYLKDIPLLGALFANQNNTRARTELLVLITPRVVHNQLDAAALTSDLRQELPSAARLPGELGRLPPSGSSDPNALLRDRLGLH
jgi:general secretion pathway protein D